MVPGFAATLRFLRTTSPFRDRLGENLREFPRDLPCPEPLREAIAALAMGPVESILDNAFPRTQRKTVRECLRAGDFRRVARFVIDFTSVQASGPEGL